MTIRLCNRRVLASAVLLAVLSACCGARDFPSERDAVAHFRAHRPQFRRAAELFLSSKLAELEITEVPFAHDESELVRLGRELRVRGVARVPGLKTENEQWIEFRLAQHLLRSTYGILYVPDGNDRAFTLITFLARSPTHGIRAIRPIEDRWFYYDYD